MGRQKVSDARWTKKNNEVHYGWKNHVKADLKTKLILKSKTTPAHVHDSQMFEQLLDDKDQAVLADSTYHSAEARGLSDQTQRPRVPPAQIHAPAIR